MNEPTEPTKSRCVKAGPGLLMRSLQWLAVLLVFALGQILVACYGPNVAATYALLVGLPLMYAFSKAVVYRIYGIPLTWRELGSTTLRAVTTTATTFAMLAMVMMVFCFALYLLLFAICGGGFHMGMMGLS